jgi:hypothetical protein
LNPDNPNIVKWNETAEADAAWHELVVGAFQQRLMPEAASYTVLSITLDRDYLGYFDVVLAEMSHNEPRLPQRRSSNFATLRSATVEVIFAAFFERRDQIQRKPRTPRAAATEGMRGDMSNIIIDGLLQRLSRNGGERLETIDCLLQPLTARRLDDHIWAIVQDQVEPDERAFWLDEGLGVLRSALIEAGALTWMVWRGLIAEEAATTRRAPAGSLQPQCTPPRLRTWSKRPAKGAIGLRRGVHPQKPQG